MPSQIKDLYTSFRSSDIVVEQNVDVKLKTASPGVEGDPLIVRVNVYRPDTNNRYPVLCTYGPYGKDIHYQDFHKDSYRDVNPKHKSEFSAWEVPDPVYWTSQGYVVVRADERGFGQSPGKGDSMSANTADGFFDVVEWCAEQSWSSGKVGLLGVSYYAGSQWRAAAKQPRGLAAIVPWEGMSDYYRDRVRHGGILSNGFIKYWWDRQVGSNQYGLPGRKERNWGPGSLEGDLTDDELRANRADQTEDTLNNRFLDDEYFASKDFDLAQVKVPLLSVANLGAINLHLRGNVLGFMGAGSEYKYLRFITGRHDVPFFYNESAEIQKSFLDAFLKGEDDRGWLIHGKVPPIDLCLRTCNPGVNNAEAERRQFEQREEFEWPIARTKYTDFHLNVSRQLGEEACLESGTLRYEAPQGSISFATVPFDQETEITGHPMARLSVSASRRDGSQPSDMDLFLTLRHLDAEGNEIFYTGPVGEPVPVVKGWLRLSLRKTNSYYRAGTTEYLPRRNYLSSDVQPVKPDTVYTVDVELWPTNVVLAKGDSLVLEVASGDTQGSGIFTHNHPDDRPESKFRGWNCIHFGGYENFLRVPVIPDRDL